MRFLMINLLLVCLLLFGIGYLAFGCDETVVPTEQRDPHTEETLGRLLEHSINSSKRTQTWI